MAKKAAKQKQEVSQVEVVAQVVEAPKKQSAEIDLSALTPEDVRQLANYLNGKLSAAKATAIISKLVK